MMESRTFYGKRLNCPGLKPTDYFLFMQAKEYFDLDMRGLLVLGVRMMYATLHGQINREQLLTMARDIHAEDLNSEARETRPTYTHFSRIKTS